MDLKEYSCKTSLGMEKIFYTWTIENYKLLHDMDFDKDLTSQAFPNDNSGPQFCLELSPTNRDLRVSLITHSYKSQQKGMVKMYLPEHSEDYTFHSFTIPNTKSLNFKYLLPNDRLPKKKLTLHCEIILLTNRVDKFVEHSTLVDVPDCNLTKDLGAKFNTKEFADATIVTDDGQRMPVHKIILSARSKVFAAMFTHPMEENIENCVVISDFTFDVVMELMRFMYTGEVPKLKEMAMHLLAAADKYELDRLKAMCVKSMRDNLSTDSAPIVLKTADLYNLEILKTETVQFIQNNFAEVAKSVAWKDMLITDRTLIIEALGEQKRKELKLDLIIPDTTPIIEALGEQKLKELQLDE